MSKVIESPVEKFPGSVTLSDPLNMSQTLGWEKAVRAAQALAEPVFLTDLNAVYLPTLLACIEAWNLTGVPSSPTLETFPFSPRLASAKLIDWLIGEITKVYAGEEIPEEEKKD